MYLLPCASSAEHDERVERVPSPLDRRRIVLTSPSAAPHATESMNRNAVVPPVMAEGRRTGSERVRGADPDVPVVIVKLGGSVITRKREV